MDLWLQKVSLIVLIIVSAVTFYGSTRDVSCWTPAEFSAKHSEYATKFCSSNGTHRHQVPNESNIPSRAEDQYRLWSSAIALKCKVLQKLLLVEIILICCVYSIIKPLVAAGSFGTNNPKNLLNSHTKAPYYIFIQVGAGCLLGLFAILTICLSEWSSVNTIFLCGFNIRRLGLINSYIAQCTEQGDTIIYTAFVANFAICLVLAVTKFVHILSAFLIQPFMGMSSVASTLVEGGAIKNPKQIGVGFAVSDLYFAMLTNGGDVKCNETKDDEKEKLMQSE